MDYKEYHSNIKSGDLIVFSATKIRTTYDLLSYIVRLFTMSEYNHVGIAWVIGDRNLIVEAQVPEVKISPLKKLGSFYHIPMGIKFTDEALEILLDKVGQKYSYLEAIKAYFNKNDHTNDDWICVDYVKYFYEAIGVDIGTVHTPSDVVKNIIRNHNKSLHYVENKAKG